MDYTVADLKAVPELDFNKYRELVSGLGDYIQSTYQIPKIVPIIQSAHESRNGNSGLARNYCNLFGIVATESWKNKGKPVASLPTWEVINGKRVDMSREFRSYPSWKESFEDWAGLITGLRVYQTAYALFKENKIEEGITEMGRAYATDPAYAKKLIAIYQSTLV